jgi:hypothetical protein
MHTQSQAAPNNPQLEIAMQQLIEALAGMMRIMTRNMNYHDSKELPLGVQQMIIPK